MSNYDQISTWHMANRRQYIGIQDVKNFTALLPARASILDLGCGHGLPISKYLIEQGYQVYAIDNAPQLLEAYKKNFPGIPTACEDIRHSPFFNRQFDGIIVYGVLFFLSEEDQHKVLHNVSKALHANGALLFTASKEAINGTSSMAGLEFPYISLGFEQYVKWLQQEGLELRSAYSDPWDNYVYIFRKAP